MTPLPCAKSFPAFFPIFRLDRVWHDKMPLDVTAQIVTDSYSRNFSDHLPILIELREKE
jgi:endonuclease/exonuclease/phosphatase family metal-dependent hydrolase